MKPFRTLNESELCMIRNSGFSCPDVIKSKVWQDTEIDRALKDYRQLLDDIKKEGLNE